MFLGTPVAAMVNCQYNVLCSPRNLAFKASLEPWVVTTIWRDLDLPRGTEEERGIDVGMRGEDES